LRATRASDQLRCRAPRIRRAGCAHASAARGGGESAEGAYSAASSPSQGNVTVVKEREGEQSGGRGTGAEAEVGSRGAVAEGGSERVSEGGSESERERERGLYTEFVEHCVEAMGQHMPLSPITVRSDWQVLEGSDGEGGKAFCRSVAVSAPKIRLMRSADISAGRTLQVLNLIAFPRPEYDLPYFCADLVTFPRGHLIVLDLNPLHQSEEHFSKYIAPIMPIANKYIEHLPWGGEFTAESLQFFSPALLWAKLPLDADVTAHVLPAFKEYLQAWLRMVETCEPTTDPAVMAHNMESQHRYICWRSVKVRALLASLLLAACLLLSGLSSHRRPSSDGAQHGVAAPLHLLALRQGRALPAACPCLRALGALPAACPCLLLALACCLPLLACFGV
ncbi:unnamed protein product, partial [Closterium sp. NIES-54]